MKSIVFTLWWSLIGAIAGAQPAIAQTPLLAQTIPSIVNAPAAQVPPSRSATRSPLASESSADATSQVDPNAFVCSFFMGKMEWLKLRFVFKMYSTYRIEDSCDQSYFNKITTASIVAQLSPVAPSALALRGGVQRYLMDVNLTPTFNPYHFVGKLRFSEAGQIVLSLFDDAMWSKNVGPTDTPDASYYVFNLNMPVHFIWNEGSLAHRLIAPDGAKYLMFAWSNQSLVDLNRDKLIYLKPRLDLPAGWDYESFLLNKTITVKALLSTGYQNKALFDELGNYYIQYGTD